MPCAPTRSRGASVASAGLAGNIPPQEILHSIAFGVGPSPPRGDVIPADDSDEVGPVVVSTIPAEGAVAVSPGDTLTLFFNEAIDKGEPGKAAPKGPAWGPKNQPGALPDTVAGMRKQLQRFEQTLSELEEQRGRGE